MPPLNSLRRRSAPAAWGASAVSSSGGRETNQDQARAEVLEPSRSLWGWSAVAIVADGMGGHADGAKASSVAIDTVWEVLGAEPRDRENFSEAWLGAPADELAARTIRLANNRILGSSAADAETRPMGTTLTLVAVRGDRAVVGHVGDSRLYLAEGRELRQVTSDHTYVAEAVAAGTLSADDAAESPFAGQLTRAVGLRPELLVDVVSLEVQPGMMLILCTDGLTGVVSDEDILAMAWPGRKASELAAELVRLAETREPTDNISVACLRRG